MSSSSGSVGHFTFVAPPQREQTHERQQGAGPVAFLSRSPPRRAELSAVSFWSRGSAAGGRWRRWWWLSSVRLYGGASSNGGKYSRSRPRRYLSSLSSRSCSLHVRCSSRKLCSSDTHSLVIASWVWSDSSLDSVDSSFSFCRLPSAPERSERRRLELLWLELLWLELL